MGDADVWRDLPSQPGAEQDVFQTYVKNCNRPFADVSEMDAELIQRHNELVGKNDIVIHAGDFCLLNKHKEVAQRYINRLNGHHIFLRGSHDRWMGKNAYREIWEKRIEGQFVVVCHYAMRRWARSHYNSWQLFGHSHGMLEPIGKQWDIGVDNNNFYPISFEQLQDIMRQRPNNPNLIVK